jgi:hypothetical protein
MIVLYTEAAVANRASLETNKVGKRLSTNRPPVIRSRFSRSLYLEVGMRKRMSSHPSPGASSRKRAQTDLPSS